MKSSTGKALALGAAMMAAIASPAAAQLSTATFGSAEAAGLGEGSALLGISVSKAGTGVSPMAQLVGYTYRYRSSATDFSWGSAIEPSVGLKAQSTTGSISGSVGYAFSGSSNVPANVFSGIGGSQSSAVVGAQLNHWGDGAHELGAIVSWSFKSDYLWSRLRAAHQLGTGSPVFAGAELIYQGANKNSVSAYRTQVGPYLQFRANKNFRFGVDGGYRTDSQSHVASGYVGAEFLILTP